MATPRARPSVVDEIYEYLRERILSGQFRDGEQLRQLEIAERMKCSQGPVRHALDRLSNEQLVLLLPNRGYFVAGISLDQARQAYELRELIEPFAATQTLRHLTEDELEEFEAQFERMKAANRRGDFKASLGADMRFHRMFYERSRYPLLLKFWEQIDTQIRKFVTVTTPIYVTELPKVTDLHVPILRAMRAKDSSGLAKAIRDHIEHVWKLVGTPTEGSGTAARDGHGSRIPITKAMVSSRKAKARAAPPAVQRRGSRS